MKLVGFPAGLWGGSWGHQQTSHPLSKPRMNQKQDDFVFLWVLGFGLVFSFFEFLGLGLVFVFF